MEIEVAEYTFKSCAIMKIFRVSWRARNAFFSGMVPSDWSAPSESSIKMSSLQIEYWGLINIMPCQDAQ